MEILITTGTPKTSDYTIIKKFKSRLWAENYAKNLGYKGGEIYNGLIFTHIGTTYKVYIN
jgi:hypothetical protein